MFAGPQKPSTFAKWAQVAPRDAVGLVAPFVFTHRTAPTGQKPWPHDATTGDFRDSPLAREALAPLAAAVTELGAKCVVFRSADAFSPSAANRDQLTKFFTEIATAEAIGTTRVWVPGGLWEVRAADKLAASLELTLAFDPLVRAPDEPPEVHENLESALYFRIEGAGRAGLIRNERLEDLAALLEHYEDSTHPSPIVAFASPERWQDARNFKKLLA